MHLCFCDGSDKTAGIHLCCYLVLRRKLFAVGIAAADVGGGTSAAAAAAGGGGKKDGVAVAEKDEFVSKKDSMTCCSNLYH